MDLCNWYEQILDHTDGLDAQVVVDVLGQFAWAKVSTLGLFADGLEMAERSHGLAAEEEVQESGWAWCAQSQAELYVAHVEAALRHGETAERAAEARGDELVALLAAILRIAPLNLLGNAERAARETDAALERAVALGHQNSISSAVISAANSQRAGEEFDVEASLDILSRHPVEPTGDLNTLWLDITWGLTLIDRDLPRATTHLVRAVRSGDQLGTPSALDQAFQLLALAAATAGLAEEAVALAAYTDANYRPYRIDNATSAWTRERLDEAVSQEREDAVLPRAQVMAIVNQLEASLT